MARRIILQRWGFEGANGSGSCGKWISLITLVELPQNITQRVAPDVLKDKITPKEEEFPTRFTDSLLFSSFMIYVVFRL